LGPVGGRRHLPGSTVVRMIDDRPVLLREGFYRFATSSISCRKGDAMAEVKPFRGIHYDVKRVET